MTVLQDRINNHCIRGKGKENVKIQRKNGSIQNGLMKVVIKKDVQNSHVEMMRE